MESWRDIEGFEGKYEVSNEGKVRNLNTGQILKSYETKDGYFIHRLSKGRRGGKTVKVHRLVAIAFIPNLENKPTVNHKDGDKSNNLVNNLEWATRSEQTQHSYNLGLKKPVYTTRKLSDEAVREIRRRYVRRCEKNGSGALSREFGVTDANILKIVKRLSYKNVE